MKKLFKKLFVSLLALSFVFAAVACGGNNNTSEEGATKVTFYLRNFEDWSVEYTQWAVKEFNKDKTDGIEVSVKFFDDAEYGQVLAIGNENGTMPDVFLQAVGQMEARIEAGQIAQLDNLFTDDELNDVEEMAKGYCTYKKAGATEKHWYAYPWLSEPNGIFMYRKDMLSKAKFTIPADNNWTWDDVLAACAAVQPNLKVGQYPLGIPYGPGMVTGMEGIAFHSAGKSILNNAWNTCQVDDDWSDFYGFLYDLFKNKYTPAALISADVTTLWESCCENKCAMTFCGSWAIAGVINNYSELADNVGFAMAPTKDGDQTRITNIDGGWNYCIAEASTHKEEAATFIKFMLRNQEVAAKYYEIAQYCKQPCLKSMRTYLDSHHNTQHEDWYTVIADSVSTSIPQEGYALSVHFAAMDTPAATIASQCQSKSKDDLVASVISTAQKTINSLITAEGWTVNPTPSTELNPLIYKVS